MVRNRLATLARHNPRPTLCNLLFWLALLVHNLYSPVDVVVLGSRLRKCTQLATVCPRIFAIVLPRIANDRILLDIFYKKRPLYMRPFRLQNNYNINSIRFIHASTSTLDPNKLCLSNCRIQ